MGKGLRTTLWILSSLAVLWTIIAVICLAGMAGTMGGRMMRPEGMEGTMNGMMGGGVMMGMMVLTWIVMLVLVGVFIYLVVMALRSRRTVQA
jgi:uncharacterized membrane protein